MKEKWQNLSKGKKTWVIIGAVVILAAAAAPLRDDDPEPAEAQEPTASPVVDEEPSEEASEAPELTHVRVIGLDGIDRYTSRSTALPYED